MDNNASDDNNKNKALRKFMLNIMRTINLNHSTKPTYIIIHPNYLSPMGENVTIMK